jgi:hypothetical protein
MVGPSPRPAWKVGQGSWVVDERAASAQRCRPRPESLHHPFLSVCVCETLVL